jgi:hypothetical protein
MSHLKFKWWIKVIELYKKDLQRIISNAPPVEKEIVIYRGVLEDYFTKHLKNGYYKNKAFVSCSLDHVHALAYTRVQLCCFKRITILPGSHILFISGISCFKDELEFVINADSVVYVHNKYRANIYNDEHSKLDDMCYDKVKRAIDIVDMVVSGE